MQTKAQALILVSLLTLLAVNYSAIHSKYKQIDDLKKYEQLYNKEVSLTDELQEENDDLKIELRAKSEALPTITKEVYEKICNGAIEEERILSAPPTKRDNTNESKTTGTGPTAYADIDAPFDPDFLRLLDE